MHKPLALALMGGLLASCAPLIRVAVPAPSIADVQNQRTFCVNRATNIDFGLNYSGNVDRIEVYATPQGSGAPSRNNPGRFVGGKEDVFRIGNGRISGSIVFMPEGANTVRVVPTQTARALSISVNPVNAYDLYFRAFSVTGDATPFVRGLSVVPDETVNCDPDLRF